VGRYNSFVPIDILRVRALCLVAVVGCGQNATSSTAGADAAATDTFEMDANLPEVLPASRDCIGGSSNLARRCVSAGWFVMSRWTTGRWRTSAYEAPRAVAQPVYLDAFEIDAHEVTNGEYATYVVAGGVAPPEQCSFVETVTSGEGEPPVRELSGWKGKSPPTDGDDLPVVCVTRREASAFCASRGGRLPRVAEWLKSAAGPFPDRARFPWGDSPPVDVASEGDDSPQFPGTSLGWAGALQYMSIGSSVDSAPRGPGTMPVMNASFGASRWGVFDLAGSVSELLASCEEDLPGAYGDGATPAVRPTDGAAGDCKTSILAAGSNWHTQPGQPAGASTVWNVRQGRLDYLGTLRGPYDGPEEWVQSVLVFDTEPAAGPVASDAAGNDLREWRLGFRCVYDVK
jgi:formylglycine-generating enzyme required for sulfatase activity